MTIARPVLNDLKRKIEKMSLDELRNLAGDQKGSAPNADNTLINNLLICEPEVEAIQKTVNDHMRELTVLTKSNEQQKAELEIVLQKYAEKRDVFDGLSQDVRELENEQAQKCLTKQQIVDIVGKRAKEHDKASKDLEKQLKDKSLDIDKFVESYMDERKAYHKMQIYKLKVGHG